MGGTKLAICTARICHRGWCQENQVDKR